MTNNRNWVLVKPIITTSNIALLVEFEEYQRTVAQEESIYLLGDINPNWTSASTAFIDQARIDEFKNSFEGTLLTASLVKNVSNTPLQAENLPLSA